MRPLSDARLACRTPFQEMEVSIFAHLAVDAGVLCCGQRAYQVSLIVMQSLARIQRTFVIQHLNKQIGLSHCSPSEQISALALCAARLFRDTPSTLAFA